MKDRESVFIMTKSKWRKGKENANLNIQSIFSHLNCRYSIFSYI